MAVTIIIPGNPILIGIESKDEGQNVEQPETMLHNEKLKEVEKPHLEKKI